MDKETGCHTKEEKSISSLLHSKARGNNSMVEKYSQHSRTVTGTVWERSAGVHGGGLGMAIAAGVVGASWRGGRA